MQIKEFKIKVLALKSSDASLFYSEELSRSAIPLHYHLSTMSHAVFP